MKLVGYGDKKKERAGLVYGDKVLDISQSWEALNRRRIPSNVVEFLEGPWREELAIILENADELATRQGIAHDISEVRLGAPVPRPGKVICLGVNYRDHSGDIGVAVPEVPLLFSKASSCIIGPREEVMIPEESDQIDWEAELAVVIGKEGKKIADSEAFEHIAGYTVFNDVSARDIQMADKQWFRGKSFDTFGPMGPWIITIDEIEDPLSLEVRCLVNGVERQHSNTSYHIFNVPQIIAFISRGMTLFPGDVIATGTPKGVGYGMNPPLFLKPGDELVTEIEGIGQLRNKIVSQEGG
jgi:2-keto-4-pentenoate hydratase/2-oxohepta-3-ene-1,7-dioic acid hydratase in catechol pathway